MAELPKSIRVGYRTYAVEEMSPAEATASGVFGDCNKVAGIIRVRSDLERQIKAEVTYHEVIHAAYYHGDLGTDDGEERVVSVLGSMLTQIWRDNPELVAFMSESLA